MVITSSNWIFISKLHQGNRFKSVKPFYRQVDSLLTYLEGKTTIILFLAIHNDILKVLTRFVNSQNVILEEFWSMGQAINFVAAHPSLASLFPKFVMQLFQSPPPSLLEKKRKQPFRNILPSNVSFSET
ncbi:MAG: hypothetical protein ACXAC7_07275 [Candidatus Hodarchaeales archaeon]|jgi:hypothetical protein